MHIYHHLRLIISALALVASAGTAFARTYVVCVGINAYPKNPLRLCVSDADSIKYIYDHQRDAQAVILRDHQGTKANIRATLKRHFAQARENDRVIFYFSGHGYPGGFCAIDGDLSYSDVQKAFSESQSKHKMIFADACFAGKMRKSKKSDQQQAQMKNADVMLCLASRSNETSIESRIMKNGYFTTYLKRGLRGSADVNRDRKITARELFNYVSEKVPSATHDKQHPVMWGNFSDDMPVISW